MPLRISDHDALARLEGTQVGADHVATQLSKMGGQAAVFTARDLRLKIDVALKVYGPFKSASELNKPLRHAQLQAQVEHPAILKVGTPFPHEYEIEGETYSFLCIPMPLAKLGSAENWSRFRDRPTAQHIEDLRLLFEGVKAIHDARPNLTHNDLKPSNLLLFEERGRVVMKITDFGLARDGLVSEQAASGLTLEYAPPEQFTGAPARPPGDIYSLGATVFQLLTGRLPFELPDDAASRPLILDVWERLHRESPRPDAAAANDKCVARLALLLIRMMAVDPEARPSIDDCIGVLDQTRTEIIGDSSGYAPSPAQAAMLERWPKRESFGTSSHCVVFSRAVHGAFGRHLFLTQIKVSTLVGMTRVFEQAVHFFGESFSLYETYGHHDLLFRVWSSAARFETFKERLSQDCDEMFSHRVEDISIPGFEEPEGELSRTKALALQEGLPLASDAADFVVRPFPDKRDWQLKAFTFIQPRSTGDRTGRRNVFARLADAVRRLPEENRVVLYGFTDMCSHLGMVEFVGDSFDSMWLVPLNLALTGDSMPYKTTTQLVTNRLVFESDQIRL